jgi:hypothetical protein
LFDVSKYGLIAAPGRASGLFTPVMQRPHVETTLYVARIGTNPSQYDRLFPETVNKRGKQQYAQRLPELCNMSIRGINV